MIIMDTLPKTITLVECGSFNPITIMHLRMLERARDVMTAAGHEVVAGVLSPVSGKYGKKGLADVAHRLEMCKAAVGNGSWIRVDDWEAMVCCAVRHGYTQQDGYTRTVNVLNHVRSLYPDSTPCLVCGADLLHSITVPGVWIPDQVDMLLGNYGIVAFPRIGYKRTEIVKSSEVLTKHREHIVCLKEPLYNNISSTLVRQLSEQGESIKYMTPDAVIDYIKSHSLYCNAV